VRVVVTRASKPCSHQFVLFEFGRNGADFYNTRAEMFLDLFVRAGV
jgi:hypothetical protein